MLKDKTGKNTFSPPEDIVIIQMSDIIEQEYFSKQFE